ncbi:hypothetical protein MferCBS49748_003302 [Microsporum ferrugineum]
MAPRNYSELGRSLGLLGDQLPWYWKVVSIGSAWSLFTGACFTSSILGLFNIVINILIRSLLPMNMLSTIIVAISCVSTTAYGFLAFYFSDYWLSVTCSRRRRRKRSRAATEAALDDTELQRRQLLRLYLRPDRAPSVELSQSTFRIDLPDHQSTADMEEEMLVTAPQNAYERSLHSVSAPSNYPSEMHPSPTSAYKLNPLRYWQPQRGHRDQMRPLAELIS